MTSLSKLKVRYIDLNKRNSKPKAGHSELDVQFSLQDSVSDFMQHLLASFDGLQRGGIAKNCEQIQNVLRGKTLFLGGKRLDTQKRSSLAECGVVGGNTLELKGYTPLSKVNYVYPITVYLDHTKVTVSVSNVTNIATLMQKLQNATGIHTSNFTLYNDQVKAVESRQISINAYSKNSC